MKREFAVREILSAKRLHEELFTWRHGHERAFVVEIDGRLWQAPPIRYTEDGLDDDRDMPLECDEVEAVQVTRTEYQSKGD